MSSIGLSSKREGHDESLSPSEERQISEINSKSNLSFQFLLKISHWVHSTPLFFLSVIQLLNGLEEILMK